MAFGRNRLDVPQRRAPRVTRRAVLLGALLPLTGCLPEPDAPEGKQDLASWLRGFGPGPYAAAVVATLYLRDAPDERSADWLARRLFGVELADSIDRAEFRALLQHVIERRQRDFVEDDLVLLEGWAVPRTEARLVTLIALCGAS